MKTHNFSAGPSILPQSVITNASKKVLDFDNELSILEISHRSNAFTDVMFESISLVRDILEVPTNYSIIFLQGGASLQFCMVALNLLKKNNGSAAYLNTGTWSKKAIFEAKKFGEIEIVGDSSHKNFNYIPKDFKISDSHDYFHCTSNNTIYGSQIKTFPKCNVPVVCDMSSDIFSRKIDVNKFGLIYAGAQKNLGPAGATLVIVKDEILGKSERDIPSMLDYRTHIDKKSMFNTPPVFSVYVSMLNLRWLKSKGGLDYIEKNNNKKSKILYEEIKRNSLFETLVNKEDQSKMNITFKLKDQKHKNLFEKICAENKISGINGHRSVGGYRASLYNALPIESVNVLVNCMVKLEKDIA